MCDVTPRAEVALPADLSAARRARTFLRASLCRVHQDAALDRALLLLSELAVNAVRHGAPPVRAVVDCRVSTVRLVVSDGSRERPQHKRSPAQAESGRGVDLVDALSESWGVRVEAHGKSVWCDLKG
ncbi:ATP-binding protein [Kineococcus sp. SYSU DK005]|uniref:ATP-binding protein n=1 Tax=Kineococcus sp. SYSU DK005 TaxID=3383126 RepID=UPI003D7D564A